MSVLAIPLLVFLGTTETARIRDLYLLLEMIAFLGIFVANANGNWSLRKRQQKSSRVSEARLKNTYSKNRSVLKRTKLL